MKLSLGTAQLGMDYGINNSTGQVTYSEAKKIIDLCKKNSINFIDTAMNYGNSEELLGKIGVKNFNVISKFPSLPEEIDDEQKWIENRIVNSLKKLKIQNFYAILFHDAEYLEYEKTNKIIQILKKLKSRGILKKYGFSVYNPDIIEDLYNKHPFDIIQVPINIIDQRSIQPNILNFLKKKKIQIQSRSIFLQGVLFMEKNKLNEIFGEWNDLWEIWFNHLQKYQLTPLEICLFFQKQIRDIDLINIGVDNTRHLNEIIKTLNRFDKIKLPKIKSKDLNLIDPRRWTSK